jgi:multidrug resistance efflux pump
MKTRLLCSLLFVGVAGGAASWYLPQLLRDVSSEGREREAHPIAHPDSLEVEAAQWVQGPGHVEPRSEVRRLVFKVDGVIEECRVEVGDRVRKGAVLMVLNNHEEEAAVAVAQRELALARAERAKAVSGSDPYELAAARARVDLLEEQVRHLRRERERTHQLFGKSAASDQEAQQARTNLAQREALLRNARAQLEHLKHIVRREDRQLADARVRRAEAQLAQARQRLKDTFLCAPCDGTVLEILKRQGEGQRLIDPEPVLLFGGTGRLRIRAEIDERHARDLRVGQRAIAFGRGLGKESFAGQVIAVRPIMGKKTAFSRSAAERKDLDVIQVLVEMDARFSAPLGLAVEVKIRVRD